MKKSTFTVPIGLVRSFVAMISARFPNITAGVSPIPETQFDAVEFYIRGKSSPCVFGANDPVWMFAEGVLATLMLTWKPTGTKRNSTRDLVVARAALHQKLANANPTHSHVYIRDLVVAQLPG